jgi:hypothetical protein
VCTIKATTQWTGWWEVRFGHDAQCTAAALCRRSRSVWTRCAVRIVRLRREGSPAGTRWFEGLQGKRNKQQITNK